jgi:hypothetical protein
MPADNLTPQQLDLVTRLLNQPSGIPRSELDGRTVRALEARDLASDENGILYPTIRARSNYAAAGGEDSGSKPLGIELSHSQYKMLTLLVRAPTPTPGHELDGRTARSLLVRGWARLVGDSVEVTEFGKEAHRQHELGTPSATPKRKRRQVDGRTQVILNAVSDLRRAIPPDSELAVGRMFCHVEDLLDSFQRNPATLLCIIK